MSKDGSNRNSDLSSVMFALETSTGLVNHRADEQPSSGTLLESTYIQNKREPKAYVLFLRDFSTPSALIEQTLKQSGIHVTVVQDTAHLSEEWETGVYGLLLLDHSLPLKERMALLDAHKARFHSQPIVMIFEPGAGQEAIDAKRKGADECLVRDPHGEYLLLITTIVEKLAEPPNINTTAELTGPARVDREEVTDQVDLRPLAAEVRGAAMESQTACLVVLAGPDVGTVTRMEGICVIGRDPSCQLRLKDESISRFHASIKQHKNGAVTIKDLDSTNGTYVNGKRQQVANLRDGEKILLGQDTLIRYQIQDAIEQSYHDELYIYSTRDGLTGLCNRRCATERIKANLSYAKRHRCPVSLMMLDIDHFKRINDTYGHQAGDLVLVTIANVMLATIREEDVLGRFGGEEFILFALDTPLDKARIFAERVRRKIEDEIIVLEGDPRSIRVTMSIGVITITPDGDYDLDQLISQADINLYKAKDGGRNRVVASESILAN